MFLDKLASLCSHLRKLVSAPSLKPSTRFILARDLAIFLGQVKSGDILPPGRAIYLIKFSARLFGVTVVMSLVLNLFLPILTARLLIYASMWLWRIGRMCFLALVFFFVSQIIWVTSETLFVGSSVSNILRKHLLDVGILKRQCTV